MLPRIHRVLPLLHQRVLADSMTTTGPNKEKHYLALGQESTTSL
jgi:hypothetical protein